MVETTIRNGEIEREAWRIEEINGLWREEVGEDRQIERRNKEICREKGEIFMSIRLDVIDGRD